jgi:GNAT superfamily N-acetyltransferase
LRNSRPFKYETARASLVFEHEGKARVVGVYAEKRGQGHARGLMEMIAYFADQNGIELSLIAQQNSDGLDNDALIDFYGKFDFMPIGRRNGLMHMVREARDTYIPYSKEPANVHDGTT